MPETVHYTRRQTVRLFAGGALVTGMLGLRGLLETTPRTTSDQVNGAVGEALFEGPPEEYIETVRTILVPSLIHFLAAAAEVSVRQTEPTEHQLFMTQFLAAQNLTTPVNSLESTAQWGDLHLAYLQGIGDHTSLLGTVRMASFRPFQERMTSQKLDHLIDSARMIGCTGVATALALDKAQNMIATFALTPFTGFSYFDDCPPYVVPE